MAIATKKVEARITGVTLDLTKEEAVFLVGLLNRTDGNSLSSPEKYSESVYNALQLVGVNCYYNNASARPITFDGRAELDLIVKTAEKM
jgi:hypothetical protein